MSVIKRMMEEEMEQGNNLPDIDRDRQRYEHHNPPEPKPKKINYQSDCHLAPVTNLTEDKEHGICTQCGKECWACDPEMLKPVFPWGKKGGQKMKILDALWFAQYGNPDQIGIVIGKDELTEEIKCYIGNANGGNETQDRQYVAETGAKFPLNAAKILFPNVFK